MRTNAMRIEDNVYYLSSERARAVALSRFDRSCDLLRTGFHIVGGAAIGFALANLPVLSAAFVKALTALPPHGM